MQRTANSLWREAGGVIVRNRELDDIPCKRRILRIPCTGNLIGAVFNQNRIEDGLLRQAWREALHFSIKDEGHLMKAYRSPKNHSSFAFGTTPCRARTSRISSRLAPDTGKASNKDSPKSVRYRGSAPASSNRPTSAAFFARTAQSRGLLSVV